MKRSAFHTNLKTKSVLKAGAAILTVCLASPVAMAQLTGENDPFVEKIVVTARKKEELAEKVPISIDVTSGLEIQQNDYRDLQELVATVPGVNLSRGGSSDLITIRGVGSGESTAFEQSVSFVADGVVFGRSKGSRLGLLDVERVEILRGPQSTYFGANTIAGVVNLTTRGADLDAGWDGYIRSAYELEQDEFIIEGATNIPVSDQLAFRIAAKYTESKGFIDNTVLGIREPAIEEAVVRGSALWRPTENLTVEAKFTYGTQDVNSGLDVEVQGCTPGTPVQPTCVNSDGSPVDSTLNFVRATNFVEERTLDYRIGVLTAAYNFDGYILTATTGYYDIESDFLVDLDGTAEATTAAASRLAVSQFDEADQVTQEIRFASPTGDTIEWVVGLFFQNENSGFDNFLLQSLVPPAPNAVGLTTIREQNAKQYSVFGSLTYNFQEDLRMIFDLRYVRAPKDTTISSNTLTAIPGNGIPDVTNATLLAPPVFNTLERTDDDFLPGVTVQYDISDNANVYGSFKQGFKAGGFSQFASTPGATTGFAAGFEPEKVNAFEVGAKGTLINNRLLGSVTLFRSIFKDRQVASLIASLPGAPQAFTQQITNAARSVSQGIEFEASGRIFEELLIQGDFTILDSDFTEFPNAQCFVGQTPAQGCVGGVQDLSDQETTFSPTWSGNVTATYQKPFRDLVFTAQPNVFFTDGFFFTGNLNPAAFQDSFYKVNLRLSVRDESDQWELAFVGRNLNDQRTSSFCQEVPGAAAGTVGCAVDTPATFAFQGRYSF